MTATVVPAQRAVLGAEVTLTYTHRQADGEPAAAGSTPTVTVTDAAGDPVTAGAVTAVSGSTGVYQSTVAAAESTATDLWTATWTADAVTHTTLVAVVGGVYFDTATIRDLEPSLNDANEYPAATLIARRPIVEFEIERITNRAFVPRFGVAVIDTGRRDEVILPEWDVRSVRWVRSLDWDGTETEWTADERDYLSLDPQSGVLRLRSVCFPEQIRVGFEFGLDRPPEDIVHAAAKRLRYWLNRPSSTLPDRATSFSADGGTFRIQTAAEDRTADDDVDAVLWRWRRRGLTLR